MARLLYDRPNLLVLDEPTNHYGHGTKEMLLVALRTSRAPCSSCRTTGAFWPACPTECWNWCRGRDPYSGGYLEYVARSGHEAPGLRA